MAQSASLARFESGEVIFRTGEEAHGFYLIESGHVDLEVAITGKPHVTVDVVSAREPLGRSWLFPPHLWHYDARAVEPTIALFSIGQRFGKLAITISLLQMSSSDE